MTKDIRPTAVMLTRPVSATPIWVGCLALLGFLGALAYSLAQEWHPYVVIWMCSLGVLVPALGYEVMVSRRSMRPRSENVEGHTYRINVKRLGFVATLVLWAFIGWLFPYYHEPGEHAWQMVTYPITVWWTLSQWGSLEIWRYSVGIIAILLVDRYLVYTDRCLPEPRDGLFSFGAWLLRRTADVDRAELKQYGLQWMVKIFFLPWMLTWMYGNIAYLRGYAWSDVLHRYTDIHISAASFFVWSWGLLRNLLYTIDLGFAVVGYACTLKLFNVHIRSAQSTVWGWVVCLACYAPFEQVTGNSFLNYHNSDDRFTMMWVSHPLICAAWAGVAVALLSVYTFATVQFGARFSNLTHRGILTTGVYGWTKHPAYVTKNAMWWWVSVPFFIFGQGWSQAVGDCIRLGLRNLLYYVRAKTEEEHLGQDEVYRQYAVWIAEHGIMARIKKFF